MKPTRLISPPGTYFVTSVTWGRRSLFVAEPMARLFLQTLYHYRRQSRFRLHAFVLMPEHFHLLLTPVEITLERAVQLIKGGYSHAVKEHLAKGLEIWQRGFTDHRIRDIADFQYHRDYIHQNPVKRRLVANACECRYCSAFPGFKLDPWPWPSAAEAELLSSA
ncbi:MAG: transposase [Terriglobales bacterium]